MVARPWRVNVLAFPGCYGAELFAVVDVLSIANAASAVLRPGLGPAFRTRVVSVRGSRVRLAGGTSLTTDPVDGDHDQVVVPAFEVTEAAAIDARLHGLAQEVAYLKGLRRRRTHVASVCGGAFLLAEAGLLDGHAATTTWLFAPELARRYPQVNVCAGEMVVQEGRIATAGAFSAGLDLAVHLVRQHAGDAVARMTARLTLTPTRPSQAPYVDHELLPVPHARFSDDVRDWLRRHLREPYDLGRLADQFHVSTRTLLRRFGRETSESPLAFLQQTRIAAARRLLETLDLSVQEIVAEVGYRDAATFRRLFAQTIGCTPAQYRRQFV